MPDTFPQIVDVTAEFLDRLDRWRGKQADRPDRARAIRRLVDIGFAATLDLQPSNMQRAADLAEEVIDQHIAEDAATKDREARKDTL